MEATKKKQTATVRISEETHNLLRDMAAERDESMQAVLDKALEQYRRQRFWEDMKTAYAAIEREPEALAAEKREFALFEGTLMDGLDPYEDWAEAAAPQLKAG